MEERAGGRGVLTFFTRFYTSPPPVHTYEGKPIKVLWPAIFVAKVVCFDMMSARQALEYHCSKSTMQK